jgi:PAS domain S-box-containing protein
MARLRQPAGMRSEVERLRARLAEAEETLSAIRSGDVDAIAVDGPNGRQIYTLQTPDRPYQIFTESMSEGAASLASDGTIIFCNQRLAEMVGRTQGKLVGAPATILVTAGQQQRFQQLLGIGKQNVARAEIQFQHQDGSTLPVLTSLKPILSEKSPGICLIATDVSDRLRAEGRATAEREKFNTILDSVPPYVCLLTPDYHVAFANREFKRRFGEAPGLRCYEALFNRNEPCEVCETYKVLGDAQPRRWEWDGPDGRTYDVYDFPFTDTDGSKLILEMGMDVTERKQAEAAVEAERQRFEAVLEALPALICLLTPDHDVAFANKAFRDRFGEAKSQKCYEYVFGNRAPCQFCEAFQVLDTKRDHDWECTTAKGRVLHAYDMPFSDVDGSPLVLEMNIDVTEQRRAEDAVRQSMSELKEAQRVAQLGSWSMDLKSGKVEWSDELYRMLGLDPSQPAVAYSEQERIFTPDSWARLKAHLEETVRTGARYELELETIRLDGAHGWMLARGEPVRDEVASITRLRGVALDITKRKLAELASRESEQKFSTLADFVPQFVWMCTPDGLNFYFNQRWFEYTGLAPEQSYGTGWNTPFHAEDKQAAWNAWNHAVSTGDTYRVESRLRAADGTFRWFLMRGMPQRDDRGKIVRWFGTCTDIEDFKRAEEEIRTLNLELEQRVRNRTAELQAILDTAPIGLAISNDPEALHIHGNRAIEQMLGAAPTGELSKAAPGSPPYHLFSNGRELTASQLPMQRAVRGEAVIGETMDVLRPDGTSVTILGSAAPLFDEQHRVRGVVGAFADITDQKRSERELKERTEELRQNQQRLIESEQRVRNKLNAILSPEGDQGQLELADILDIPALQSLLEDFSELFHITLGIVDIQGRVLAVSKWQKICRDFHRASPESCTNCLESDVELSGGVPPGEFKIYKCKNNMWDVATPIVLGNRQVGNLYLGQILLEDEPTDYEAFRRQAKRYGFDEKEYLAALESVPRLDRQVVNASMAFLSKFAQVLSQLSYSGIKLARSSAQLARLNAQLDASNKELEAFSYSVSHDLRAPLRHISGFSKILTEEFGPQLPEDAQHHLHRIQEGTRRMGQLIDDLLNLGRVGRHELRRQATSLEDIVHQVLIDLEPECEGRNIEWKVGSLPFVDSDGALLKQVFQNLLLNALKFTRPCKQAEIEIGCAQQEGVPVIFVRDNGVGFNMKYATKLFGVFQRMHRAEDFEGTGVGLATVQRIVQKHGGRVWAEAELNQGATFYFTLAASDKALQETATKEEVVHELAGD